MNCTPLLSVKLEKPCGACGYGSGNVLRLYRDRVAIKCGSCDCFQFAINLQKQGKQGRAAK